MSDLDRQASGIDSGEPDFWDADELDHIAHDYPLDEWVMDCGDPKCCMNFAPHYRNECYTPEMYDAYCDEMKIPWVRLFFRHWVENARAAWKQIGCLFK